MKGYFIAISLFIAAINAVVIQDELQSDPLTCPSYQYKCPSCNNETEICVYPDSGGCLGAGIPTCQSTQCEDAVCITERQPCPDECPFSCKYNGPPCCPFVGEPVCEPVCAIACEITPCSKECTEGCHYPDAEICCPQSGTPVCNISPLPPTTTETEHDNKGKKQKWGPKSHANYGSSYSAEFASYKSVDAIYNAEYATSIASQIKTAEEEALSMSIEVDQIITEYGYYGSGYASGYGEYASAAAGGYVYGYPGYYDGANYEYDYYGGENIYDHGIGDNPQHYKGHPDRYRDEHHYVGDDDYFEGLFIGGEDSGNINHRQRQQTCPTCTKTVTDLDISLEFVTTTRDPGDIVCAQYIIPCPYECPYSCIYPMDQPCPFIEQPWCPSIFDNIGEEEDDCIYNTEGYPFPYFPPYDPYHSIFTSILNDSGVTSTPAFVTEIATTTPVHPCPLIFRFCPIDCPNSCLRPDVPCPFAAQGYCPGSSPTTTISNTELETPTESTFVGTGLICPLYILACPYCPEGYSCTRAATGNCPNTNVPFCTASAIATSPPDVSVPPIFEYYPSPSPKPTLFYYRPPLVESSWNFGWGYHPYNGAGSASAAAEEVEKEGKMYAQVNPASDNKKGKKEEEDVCAKRGLTKVHTRQVFDQLQERRSNCKEQCEILEWDEECDNTCIYQTETTCCIQTICLPNN